MHRIFSGFAAVTFASIVSLGSFASASAAPLSGMAVAAPSDVILAQYHRDPPPPRHGRHDRRGPHRDRPGSWNGYHGYNHARPGYRRHNDGFWYPLGAFSIRIK